MSSLAFASLCFCLLGDLSRILKKRGSNILMHTDGANKILCVPEGANKD